MGGYDRVYFQYWKQRCKKHGIVMKTGGLEFSLACQAVAYLMFWWRFGNPEVNTVPGWWNDMGRIAAMN